LFFIVTAQVRRAAKAKLHTCARMGFCSCCVCWYVIDSDTAKSSAIHKPVKRLCPEANY